MPDLSTLTVEELKTLIADANAAMKAAETRQRKAALDAAAEAAKAHGFTLSQLTGTTAKAPTVAAGTPRKRTDAVHPPKYANPADSTQTWSGRGRRPVWVNDLVASGATLESAAI